jgi:hypothetical protein
MALDVSWLNFYMPIFGFLFVFVVILAVLMKTKILGENQFVNLIISFVFAIIFITFSPGLNFVSMVVPWFVILVIALFFVLMLIGFSQKDMDKMMKPWLAWVFIGALMVVFLVSAMIVFGSSFQGWLPGQADNVDANPFFISVKHFIYGEKFLGALLLFVVAVAASWVITKKN